MSIRRKLGMRSRAYPLPAWSPLHLAPYAGWDALLRPDLLTVPSNSKVSSWKDCVAGYDLTQATDSARPVRDGVWVRGDGISRELTLAGVPAGIPTGATPCEMWWLVDQQMPAANLTAAAIGGYGGSAYTTSRQLRRNSSSGTASRPRLRDSNAADLTGVAIDFTGRWAVRTRATGTEITLEAGGITSTTARVSNIGTDRIRLFADPVSLAAVSFWAGGISALWITPLLTADQGARMYAYLNARVIAP